MQKITLIFLIAALGSVTVINAATYSTEATMSLQKDEGTYLVEVKVCELIDQNGKTTERVVALPRLQSAPGVEADFYTGKKPGDPDYSKEENVSVEVSWPYPNESGTAFCSVTVRRGDSIVSKSKMQLKIDGPGRIPLVLTAPDADPQSVKVSELRGDYYVLLKLAGRTKQEAKKLSVENLGNRVQVRDARGRVTDAGLSTPAYDNTGLALQCANEAEANRIAGMLRGEATR